MELWRWVRPSRRFVKLPSGGFDCCSYPMRWPEAVQSFEVQRLVRQASPVEPIKVLLHGRLKLLPNPVICLICYLPTMRTFGGIVSRCQWQVRIKDRLVLSNVVLLYLSCPASQTEHGGISMREGWQSFVAGSRSTGALLIGAHLTVVLLISLPQILLYQIAADATFHLYRRRERLGDKQVQFRWGLLYAGFRAGFGGESLSLLICYFYLIFSLNPSCLHSGSFQLWSKVSMILVGGVFGFHLKLDMQAPRHCLDDQVIWWRVLDEHQRSSRAPMARVRLPFCLLVNLHAGTVLFIGEKEGRVSHESLTALSFYVVLELTHLMFVSERLAKRWRKRT